MSHRNIFVDFYGPIVVVVYTLLTAMVIFFMALPMGVKVSCLVVSAAVYAVSMRGAAPDGPPMGTGADSEGIARPRPGLDPHSRATD